MSETLTPKLPQLIGALLTLDEVMYGMRRGALLLAVQRRRKASAAV